MNTEEITRTTSEMWDRVFRSLNNYDEQAVERFIRMVVAGRPEQPKPEPRTC